MTAAPVRRRRGRGEWGQAAGIETIPFGILVFVGGMLLAVNVWAAVDTRVALDSAARDYLRAYTAAATSSSGRVAGRAAAIASVVGRSGAGRVRIVDPAEAFGPCRPATVVLELDVAALHVPFIGDLGATTVTARQTELVQPYGQAADESDDATATACDG